MKLEDFVSRFTRDWQRETSEHNSVFFLEDEGCLLPFIKFIKQYGMACNENAATAF
jgi:hypothetical protein